MAQPAAPPLQLGATGVEEDEKARLQRILNDFISRAVKGIPCTLLDEATGERVQSVYQVPLLRTNPPQFSFGGNFAWRFFYWQVDEGLQNLIFVDGKRAQLHCPTDAVLDVFAGGDDEDSCFSKAVMKGITQVEKQALVRIFYSDAAGKECSLSFLERSRAQREVFLECLKVLCAPE
eukprot:3523260-Amphidinium_carterae.1